MEIDDRLARVLFDVAVHSMDFGSGFLDDEEVQALREAALLLGVHPDEATPRNFRCQYRGHHEAEPYLDHPYFDDPSGVPRNACRRIEDFPPDCRRQLRRISSGISSRSALAMLDAPVIRMYCKSCGMSWDALDPPPRLRP